MKGVLPYSRQWTYRIYAAWWAGWTFLQIFVLHRMGLDWTLSAADALLFSVLLGAACYSAFLVFRFYQPGPSNRIYRLLFAVGITVVFCFAFRCLMSYIYSDNQAYLEFLHSSMPLRFDFALLMLALHVVIMWFSGMLKEQQVLTRHRSETEALAREAELAKLRQQLQPHFLFNSLNSISALAGSDPASARRMIQQLSDFLRGTLRKDENQTITLAEELTQLDLYLEIEKVRFGHRLSVLRHIDRECLSLTVPPMLLQPLVENAIKFGLYGTVDETVIEIFVKCENRQLVLSVSNPFDSSGSTQGAGTGFGLNSLSRRLQLLYGRVDLLETSNNGAVFTTTIRIPQ